MSAGASPKADPIVVVAEQLRRPVPGGIGRYADGLLGGLRELAGGPGSIPPVVVHASRHRGAGADPLARWGFPVRTSPLPGRVLVAAWDRAHCPAPGPASLVHSVSLASPPPTRRSSGGGSAPLVVTVHDLAWRAHPESTTARGRRWHEAALRRAVRRADALVAPSPAVGRQLEAAGAARVAVIEHGLDHLAVPDDAGALDVLARLGVGGPYLLSVGTLEPRKNLARLTSAYGAARAELPEPWPLVVVGPAGWGNTGLGAVPGVVLAGYVSDAVLSGLYARARALAYVPLAEGYGLPPLEAMAAGTPVLTSRAVPSTDPVAGAPESALRVAADDVDAIAAGLVRVATDEGLRRSLAAAGQARVVPLTWRRCATSHLALWASLTTAVPR